MRIFNITSDVADDIVQIMWRSFFILLVLGAFFFGLGWWMLEPWVAVIGIFIWVFAIRALGLAAVVTIGAIVAHMFKAAENRNQ